MGPDNAVHPIASSRVVLEVPGMEDVTVRPEIEYPGGVAGARTLDVYFPPGAKPETPLPAVIFVIGYSDRGAMAMFGRRFKDMEPYTSWGRLIAASGMAAVTYSPVEPAADLGALLGFLRREAGPLGLDPSRLALWACSGNVPTALSALAGEEGRSLACAVLTHGYMLDLDGSTAVAEAARTYGFAVPAAGRSVDDLPPDLPLFIVRAGRDEMPRLNGSIDRFLSAALARNLPLTFVNHAPAPHAYDIFDASAASREVIRRILGFLRHHLEAAAGRP